MEMRETERELRRTMDQIDPRPTRSVASSAPPASSHIRKAPPSNEHENSIQPPTAKPGSNEGTESKYPEEHG